MNRSAIDISLKVVESHLTAIYYDVVPGARVNGHPGVPGPSGDDREWNEAAARLEAVEQMAKEVRAHV